MFIRFHTRPKICRLLYLHDMDAKQRYYYKQSFVRYAQTEAGKHFAEMGRNMPSEIGRVDNVRFIISDDS